MLPDDAGKFPWEVLRSGVGFCSALAANRQSSGRTSARDARPARSAEGANPSMPRPNRSCLRAGCRARLRLLLGPRLAKERHHAQDRRRTRSQGKRTVQYPARSGSCPRPRSIASGATPALPPPSGSRGFASQVHDALDEAGRLLDTGQGDSDVWFGLAGRLKKGCWQLGSATYCLQEWPEPDDARADSILAQLTGLYRDGSLIQRAIRDVAASKDADRTQLAEQRASLAKETSRADGDTDQTKALLRILIADLRVNSRAEVLPTYRVGPPVVCAPTSSVEPAKLEPCRPARSRRQPCLTPLRLRNRSSSPQPRVLTTSAFPSHARRAVITPQRMF
jgi:hypothetical protein